ncbi:MAG: ferric reductase-like transmembrane domain-containing protein [Desulfurivibrionaceae bacterium]|nr:ferric reductase-like transmembrane domain-containing protein [Desulfurivibrionaceae bacterium]
MALFPCLVLLSGNMPPGYGYLWDFSLALGYGAASMMAIMFFLTARFKRPALPFGVDVIYYFHKYIALLLFVIVAAHPAILLATEPVVREMLKPAQINRYMVAGVVSFLLLTLIVVSSLWRKQLNIPYDTWRLIHALLAIAAFILALIHIEGAGYYINTPAKRLIWPLIMVCWLLIQLYVRLIRPLRLLSTPYRVKEVIKEADEVYTLVVEPRHHEIPAYKPGQFAWLTMFYSPFSMKEHPFSFSSNPEQKDELRFTIKELGDFTKRIKDAVPDQTVYIDAPYGAFTIDRHPSERGYVFIAGGIGIAPLRSMLRALADRKDQRPHILFFAGKSLEKMAFYEELKALPDQLNLKVVFLPQHPPANWSGETGYLNREILARHLPTHLPELNYFICGPAPLMDMAEKELHAMGVPLQNLHSELFDFV